MFVLILNYILNMKYCVPNMVYVFQILYICITKIVTKTVMTSVDPKKQTELVFKDYYESIPETFRNNLVFEMVPKYLSISSFYRKKNDNSFSELEFEKLEEITKLKFKRNDSA